MPWMMRSTTRTMRTMTSASVKRRVTTSSATAASMTWVRNSDELRSGVAIRVSRFSAFPVI